MKCSSVEGDDILACPAVALSSHLSIAPAYCLTVLLQLYCSCFGLRETLLENMSFIVYTSLSPFYTLNEFTDTCFFLARLKKANCAFEEVKYQ